MNKSEIKYLLKEYNSIESKILDYFKFEQDWQYLPIMDHTDLFWRILEDEEKVIFYETKIAFVNGDYYEGDLIWKDPVTRAGGLALIRMDTKCDMNKFLCVFDESLEA